MEPGVPYPLLGGVELLAVAAWLGLAGTAGAGRFRSRSAPLLVLGALILAATDAATAIRFGVPSSPLLAGLRAGGFLLVAAGLLTGNLARATSGAAVAVVVPLGAPLPLAGLGAVTALAAAVTSVRVERSPRTACSQLLSRSWPPPRPSLLQLHTAAPLR